MKPDLEQFIEQLTSHGLYPAHDEELSRRILESSTIGDAVTLLREGGIITKFQSRILLGEEQIEGRPLPLSVGDYILVEPIGRGGMGLVLKAQHRLMRRFVAIKLIAGSGRAKKSVRSRMQREIQLTAQLEHPNIVTAYDAGITPEGAPYLVMQYVDAESLSSRVHRQGIFGIPDALAVILQCAEAMHYAHQKGVIHRDIKPGNILLDEDGSVRILDLGLARLDSEISGAGNNDDYQDLTSDGSIMGTVDYMSPEQSRNARSADQRSDIYSLACTLFFLLTGQPPYRSDSAVSRLMQHQQSEIPSIRHMRPDCTDRLDAIFSRMMSKDPGDRHSTMQEVIEDLKQLDEQIESPDAMATMDELPGEESGILGALDQLRVEESGHSFEFHRPIESPSEVAADDWVDPLCANSTDSDSVRTDAAAIASGPEAEISSATFGQTQACPVDSRPLNAPASEQVNSLAEESVTSAFFDGDTSVFEGNPKTDDSEYAPDTVHLSRSESHPSESEDRVQTTDRAADGGRRRIMVVALFGFAAAGCFTLVTGLPWRTDRNEVVIDPSVPETTTPTDVTTSPAADHTHVETEHGGPHDDTDPVKVPTLTPTIVSVPEIHVEPINYVAQFDGVDDYITISANWVELDKELTIEFRAQLPAVRTGRRGIISIPGAPGLSVVALGSIVRAEIRTGTARATCSTKLELDESDVRVAVVWAIDEVRLFVNGELRDSGQLDPATDDPSDTLAVIGAESPSRGFFAGSIDELRVSDIARYDADYDPNVTLTTDVGTQLFYQFNTGQGDRVIDSSANERHGTAHGEIEWIRSPPADQ